ncbi:hypothetical protein SmJEL517_g04518 [Synchytrium microbalum]|uniref:DNA replication licensing factor MCM2 n=1 Tax=Synchytrium microbalum TaxID=1806994 RepID=A0A507BZT8_9FUNG|nr:uncharacterized protein SmJEL517_g04518 [Synchytrium microbalum]TPX32369.1 hypothetical protein SmJEL517_g04518 [Synchytrium microbalum]
MVSFFYSGPSSSAERSIAAELPPVSEWTHSSSGGVVAADPRPTVFDLFAIEKVPESKMEVEASPTSIEGSQADTLSVSKSPAMLNKEDYCLGKIIGKGGFGVVRLALHKSGATFVVKSVQLTEKSMQELNLLSWINHRNVVKLIGYWKTDDTLSMVLEWSEGGSVASMIKTFEPLNEPIAAVYIYGLLEALSHIHSHGLVHLDVKCANILVNKAGLVCLTDFGVSKYESELLADPEAFEGSPYWIAPELITLEGGTRKSDIWSLGCSLVEMISGSPPYIKLGPMSALFRIVEDEEVPLPEGISVELTSFLRACLQKDPKKRASAADLMKHQWIVKHRPSDLTLPLADDNVVDPLIDFAASKAVSFAVDSASSAVSTATSDTAVCKALGPDIYIFPIRRESLPEFRTSATPTTKVSEYPVRTDSLAATRTTANRVSSDSTTTSAPPSSIASAESSYIETTNHASCKVDISKTRQKRTLWTRLRWAQGGSKAKAAATSATPADGNQGTINVLGEKKKRRVAETDISSSSTADRIDLDVSCHIEGSASKNQHERNFFKSFGWSKKTRTSNPKATAPLPTTDGLSPRIGSVLADKMKSGGMRGWSGMSKRQREDSPTRSGIAPSSPAGVGDQEEAPEGGDLPFQEDDNEPLLEEAFVNDIHDEEDEDDEGEDLFGDNLAADYQENERLDRYDGELNIDDEDYDEMDMADRLAINAKLNRRDREAARREGRGDAFGDSDDDDHRELPMIRRHRRQIDLEDEEADEDAALPLEALQEVKGPISAFVQMNGPRNAIKREFGHFLNTVVDEGGQSVYGLRIKAMAEANGESLEVDYNHLQSNKAILAYYLSDSPNEMLKIFDEVALEMTVSMFVHYKEIQKEIHVRITNLPSVDSLRDLRQSHLNSLVRTSGVVTRRTGVFPQLRYIRYRCLACDEVSRVHYQDPTQELRVRICEDCQGRNTLRICQELTIYRNFQKLTLQESPGTVPAGRLPRHKEVILTWDLVDSARPGEEVEITGIYRNNFDMSLNSKNGFPVFATVIEANHISKKEDLFASTRLTEDDIKQIRSLGKDDRVRQRIIKSIAPSIFGHEDIKTALALAMFGGVAKNPGGKHRIRGDINVLVLGDPGTAKSQFLKYIEKTAHRAVYTTGQGASAVGLTASVHKDVVTREWTLEGGAMVMADKGVCLIDEFDKMNDKDRTSIHEAMEQQSISISKAGIVTTLQARCCVIAAANPIRGRYNPQIPFSQNVELTEPILSRFDILCVVRDTADPVADEALAMFVVNSHIRSHPDNQDAASKKVAPAQDKEIIPQELLQKYIMYARDHVHPRISDADTDKIAALYSDLRRESQTGGSVPITARSLESIIRMAEAFARMHLRDVVLQSDIDRAMSIVIRSFIGAQKYSVKKQLARAFSKYVSYDQDHDELANHILSQLQKETTNFFYYQHDEMPERVEIDSTEFATRCKEVNIYDVLPFYQSRLFRDNFVYDHVKRVIVPRR